MSALHVMSLMVTMQYSQSTTSTVYIASGE